MPRYTRNTTILAKIETPTYGVDAVPTNLANAILVSNASVTTTFNPVNRDLLRGYMGGSEQLAGTEQVELTFDVEFAGSGTAGTAPAYGPLLRACGWAETATGGVRVEYNPVTPVADSVTIYYFVDGVRKIARGCRGTFTINMTVSERPMLSFTMTGISGTETANTPGTLTLTGWRAPLVVSDPNTADLTLGATYTAATPTLTGGTGYKSRGISIDAGNAVGFVAMLGGESVEIANRETTATISLDLTAANEVTFMSTVRANTLQSIGLMHGTASGGRVMFFAPAAQLANPKYSDQNGIVMVDFDVRLLPSAGNDELKIVVH
jgi:hypothetical protein